MTMQSLKPHRENEIEKLEDGGAGSDHDEIDVQSVEHSHTPSPIHGTAAAAGHAERSPLHSPGPVPHGGGLLLHPQHPGSRPVDDDDMVEVEMEDRYDPNDSDDCGSPPSKSSKREYKRITPHLKMIIHIEQHY